MYFVDLPAGVENAITVLILAIVWFIVNFIIARVPFLSFIGNYANELGLLAAVYVIGQLENILPSAYPEIAILAVQLVVAVLTVIFGLNKFLALRGVRGFKN